jgi:hypothetical protein
MKVHETGLALLFLLLASTCAAQSSQDNSSSPANGAKPSANAPDSSNHAGEKKKPKKVWTNDEIGSAKGTISVVGDSNASSNKQGPKKSEGAPSSGDTARNQQLENYRVQIQEVHSQMDAIDKRIAQLKSFKAENTSPSSGININQGYNMVPIEDQVKQLEDKKKRLEGKIEDIEVAARKNGIDPGDLR